MKILHFKNTANIAGILGKYQRLNGHEVDVFADKRLDIFKFYEYGGIKFLDKLGAMEQMLFTAKNFDIIHIHALPQWIPLFRRFLPDKIIIMHYHGHDVNHHNAEVEKCADKILCSTPTLWQEGFTYLPNPVDLINWKCRKHGGNKALWFKQWSKGEFGEGWDKIEPIVKEECVKEGLDLTVIERWKDIRRYCEMQLLYDKFDVWVEYKDFVDYSKGETLSMSAMESLACGLKVFYLADKRYISEFPEEHEAFRVVEELDKIYKEVLEK